MQVGGPRDTAVSDLEVGPTGQVGAGGTPFGFGSGQALRSQGEGFGTGDWRFEGEAAGAAAGALFVCPEFIFGHSSWRGGNLS